MPAFVSSVLILQRGNRCPGIVKSLREKHMAGQDAARSGRRCVPRWCAWHQPPRERHRLELARAHRRAFSAENKNVVEIKRNAMMSDYSKTFYAVRTRFRARLPDVDHHFQQKVRNRSLFTGRSISDRRHVRLFSVHESRLHNRSFRSNVSLDASSS